MLSLLMVSSWLVLGAYSFWFFFKAKTFQPLTLNDLALMWKLHKQQTGCTASRIHSLITKNNEVVGFKCDCGYTFLQKRLISQKVHMHPQTSIVASIFSNNNEFRKILLDTIDKSLNQILGESATQTIYFALEQKHGLKREDIPDNLKDFNFALEKIFGVGRLLIEKTIIENLYSRLSLDNKNLRLTYKSKEQFNFTNCINDLKILNEIVIKHSPNDTKVPDIRCHSVRNLKIAR